MKLLINDARINVDNRDYDLDTVTAKHTAFRRFIELVNAPGGYRPSIYLGGKSAKAQRELLFLTFKYNLYQQSHGDPRRVFKGDWCSALPGRHPILDETVFSPAEVTV